MAKTPEIDIREDYGRNYVINGNFDFWQRLSSSQTVDATVRYHADRFSTHRDTGGAATTSIRSTDVPTLAESQFQSTYSMRIDNPTAVAPGVNDVTNITYKIEGHDYVSLHGGVVTLSFWVKSSITGIYSISLRNSAGDRNMVTSYTVDVANTWEEKEITIQLDNAGTWLFDNQQGVSVNWILAAGTNRLTSTLDTWSAATDIAATGQANIHQTGATFFLAQVQIVQGSEKLPFRRAGKTIVEELELCQRYFEKSGAVDSSPATGPPYLVFNNINSYTTSAIPNSFVFKTRKRANPTMGLFDQFGNGGFGDASRFSTIAGGGAATNNVAIAGANIGSRETHFYFQNGATGSYAGYYVGWMADSEL